MKKFIVTIISALCLILVSSCEKEYCYYGTPEEETGPTPTQASKLFNKLGGKWVPTEVYYYNADEDEEIKMSGAKIERFGNLQLTPEVFDDKIVLKGKFDGTDEDGTKLQLDATIEIVFSEDGKTFTIQGDVDLGSKHTDGTSYTDWGKASLKFRKK